MLNAATVPLSLAVTPPPTPPGRFVNADCVIHERDGLRVAMFRGIPFHSWPVGDLLAENLFVVQARQAQIASIRELAVALGRSERSLFLAFQKYARGGVAEVVPKRRGRPTGSGDVLRDLVIRRLHADGAWTRAIAAQLRCSPTTVTRALARMGLEPNRVRQKRIFDEVSAPVAPVADSTAPAVSQGGAESPAHAEAEPASATSEDGTPQPCPAGTVGAVASPPSEDDEPLATSMDTDPLDRSLDRLMAARGALFDAAPLFAPGQNLPWAGVLLAIPPLVQCGLLTEARRLYWLVKPAFYGVRSVLLLVVLLTLLRVKRPEQLKEFAPSDLGRVVGLDRVPEVKTMRRKLHELAAGPSEALLLAVARRRANACDDALAWLYVDGHVRVYSGRERLPMTHVARMRISLPATQDVWVHDGEGRPVLFVTQEAHPSLAAALPPVLEAAREVVGQRRVTVVFDRGGWSPKLFAALHAANADVLTYRKGKVEPMPEAWFEPRPGRPGEPDWLLHDMSVRLDNGLWMRQITRLVDGHQTAIVTTRQDLPAETLARRMFDRWRQENFFKYMREEFAIDGLCEYGAESDDPLREAPNPEWTHRDKALRAARDQHQARVARTNDLNHPEVLAAAQRVQELRRQRNAVPRRVLVGSMENPTVRLPARVKNLYDGLKAIAWQIETDLTQAVAPFYSRSLDEGRTLIAAALRSAGSLEVTPQELIVTLAPQSSPHRTHAIGELCRLLDQTATRFPGTRLRLRYRVEGAETDAASS